MTILDPITTEVPLVLSIVDSTFENTEGSHSIKLEESIYL